jgi:hypothetical protein
LNIDFNIVNTNGVFVNVFTDVDSGGDFVIIDGAGVYIDGFFYYYRRCWCFCEKEYKGIII